MLKSFFIFSVAVILAQGADAAVHTCKIGEDNLQKYEDHVKNNIDNPSPIAQQILSQFKMKLDELKKNLNAMHKEMDDKGTTITSIQEQQIRDRYDPDCNKSLLVLEQFINMPLP